MDPSVTAAGVVAFPLRLPGFSPGRTVIRNVVLSRTRRPGGGE